MGDWTALPPYPTGDVNAAAADWACVKPRTMTRFKRPAARDKVAQKARLRWTALLWAVLRETRPGFWGFLLLCLLFCTFTWTGFVLGCALPALSLL